MIKEAGVGPFKKTFLNWYLEATILLHYLALLGWLSSSCAESYPTHLRPINRSYSGAFTPPR